MRKLGNNDINIQNSNKYLTMLLILNFENVVISLYYRKKLYF